MIESHQNLINIANKLKQNRKMKGFVNTQHGETRVKQPKSKNQNIPTSTSIPSIKRSFQTFLIFSSFINAENSSNLNNQLNNKISVTATQKNSPKIICQNNSDCNFNGNCLENICLCKESFSGINCQLSDPKVQCNPTNIKISINKNWANNIIKIHDPKQLFLGSIYTKNQISPNCQFKINKDDLNEYVLVIDENSKCNTKIFRNEDNDYVYENEVFSNKFFSTLTSSAKTTVDLSNINRLPRVSVLKWSCVYKSKYSISNTNSKRLKFINEYKSSTSQISLKVSQTNKNFKQILKTGDSLNFEILSNSNYLIKNCQLEDVNNKLDDFKTGKYDKNLIKNVKFCPKENEKLNFNVVFDNNGRAVDEYPVVYLKCDFKQQDKNFCQNNSNDNNAGRALINENWLNKILIENDENAGRFKRDIHENITLEYGPFVIINDQITNPEILNEIQVNLDATFDRIERNSRDKYGEDGEHNGNSIDIKQDFSNTEKEIYKNYQQNYPSRQFINLLDNLETQIELLSIEEVNNVLRHIQNNANKIAPLVHQDVMYNLIEDDLPGPKFQNFVDQMLDYEETSDERFEQVLKNLKIEETSKKKENKVQTMIILVISIGGVATLMIILPIAVVFYKNNTRKCSGSKSPQNGRKEVGIFEPTSTITTTGEGINVDHALHFVEYTDHIHDMVFEEDYGEYPTNKWIKQISIDAQSIDISYQDPIKMTYTNSIYTKNVNNPNNILCTQDDNSATSSKLSSTNSTHPIITPNSPINNKAHHLPMPSYGQINNNNQTKGERKTFKVAGVKIPGQVFSILPRKNQKTARDKAVIKNVENLTIQRNNHV